jgi:hypothetical protein
MNRTSFICYTSTKKKNIKRKNNIMIILEKKSFQGAGHIYD